MYGSTGAAVPTTAGRVPPEFREHGPPEFREYRQLPQSRIMSAAPTRDQLSDSYIPSRYPGSESVIMPAKQQSFNPAAIFMNIFLPWLTFSTLHWVMSFSLHHQQPLFAWSLVALGLLVALVPGFLAHKTRAVKQKSMWYTFATLAMVLAVSAAAIFGSMNYWYNMHLFYDIENFKTYPSINPAHDKGQQVIDAGRVYFSEGSHLDMTKAVGFKNSDMYCVTPIVNGDAELYTYDFWAVGVNCCSGVASDFRCGEFNNPLAHSGLRIMNGDQQAPFRLAVQQAEATYSIKAVQPLFFQWTQDPVAETNAYRDNGLKYYLFGIFAHFIFNLVCVVFATISFSKFG